MFYYFIKRTDAFVFGRTIVAGGRSSIRTPSSDQAARGEIADLRIDRGRGRGLGSSGSRWRGFDPSSAGRSSGALPCPRGDVRREVGRLQGREPESAAGAGNSPHLQGALRRRAPRCRRRLSGRRRPGLSNRQGTPRLSDSETRGVPRANRPGDAAAKAIPSWTPSAGAGPPWPWPNASAVAGSDRRDAPGDQPHQDPPGRRDLRQNATTQGETSVTGAAGDLPVRGPGNRSATRIRRLAGGRPGRVQVDVGVTSTTRGRTKGSDGRPSSMTTRDGR